MDYFGRLRKDDYTAFKTLNYKYGLPYKKPNEAYQIAGNHRRFPTTHQFEAVAQGSGKMSNLTSNFMLILEAENIIKE